MLRLSAPSRVRPSSTRSSRQGDGGPSILLPFPRSNEGQRSARPTGVDSLSTHTLSSALVRRRSKSPLHARASPRWSSSSDRYASGLWCLVRLTQRAQQPPRERRAAAPKGHAAPGCRRARSRADLPGEPDARASGRGDRAWHRSIRLRCSAFGGQHTSGCRRVA
jgi:hypothetical protein